MIKIEQKGKTEFLNFPNKMQMGLDIEPIRGIIVLILIILALIFESYIYWIGSFAIVLWIFALRINIEIFKK